MNAVKKVKDAVGRIFNRRDRQYDLEDYIQHQRERGYDGSLQVVDSTPMAPPIGYKRQPSMVELVREAVRSEHLARAAREAGAESFEESDDFDVGDDPDQMRSPWENEFDPPVEELLKAGREAMAERKKSEKPAGAAPAPKPGRDPAGGKPAGERLETKPPALPENEE